MKPITPRRYNVALFALVLAGWMTWFGLPVAPVRAAFFSVNSGGDEPDATPGDGLCAIALNDSNCTLRAAIQEANAQGGTNGILFHAPLLIDLGADLPPVLHPISIQSLVTNGSIEIVGNGAAGFDLRGGHSFIDGLVINGCSTAVTLRDNDINEITRCFIGTDVTGTIAKPNVLGLQIFNSSSNFVGGITFSDYTVISGNSGNGIDVQGNSTANAFNYLKIGSDVTGSNALGNAGNGLQISGAGSAAMLSCYVAANGLNGILVESSGPLSVLETIVTANELSGLVISNTAKCHIGGVSQVSPVVFSTCGRYGIEIVGAASTSNQIGLGEVHIGVDFDTDSGVTNAFGNELGGILINGASGNNIDSVVPNTIFIAFNGGPGVTILNGTNNSVGTGVAFFSNTGIGIDLGGDGPTANDDLDPDEGANHLLNHPVLTSATVDGTNIMIVGTFNSTPNSDFEIDLFSSTECDNPQGGVFLGYTFAFTDANGNASFDRAINAEFVEGNFITALARPFAVINPYKDYVSEFAPCVQVIGAGDGSLPTEDKLTPSDATENDQFGQSVAISGDTLVGGAEFGDSTEGELSIAALSGAAYVFVRSGTDWTEQAKLIPSDGAVGDSFGFSMAIDGDTIVAGAPNLDDPNIGSSTGAAYVFVRNGTNWTSQAKLSASDAAIGNEFGHSVGISGNTIVVGAVNGDAGIQGSAGALYVFVRSGTNWTEQAKLTASDAAMFDALGTSVGVSGDTVVGGALTDDDPVVGVDAGSAYVFVRNGTNWTQQARLSGSDLAAGDRLGNSVAISSDTIVAGTQFGEAAYVYVRTGTNWVEQIRLTSSDNAFGDQFGSSVGISGDSIVAGAWQDDDACNPPEPNCDSGSAYVFARSGTNWTERTKLVPTDTAQLDHFGIAVAISGDNAVVGARDDDDGGSASGAAYAFSHVPGCTLVCPSDIVTNLPSGQTSAIVNFPDPILTGDCPGVSTSYDPVSGSSFALGTNSVTSTATDLAGTTNQCTFNVIVLGSSLQADLAATKTDSPDPVAIGSNLTYTVTVTNKGPATATSVTLTDTLPSSADFVSASSGCTNIGGTVTCELGVMANGSSTSVTIVVTPTVAGSITNTVVVAANEADPVAGNNTATAVTTVSVPTQLPDLSVGVNTDPIVCTNTSKGVVCTTDGTLSLLNNSIEYGSATFSLTSTCKTKPGKPSTCKLAGVMNITSFNLGDTPPAFLGLYLSDDPFLDGLDAQLLKKEVSTATLQALFDEIKAFKVKAKVPKGVDLSGKFILVVIDTTGAVVESNEGNNFAVFGPLP